jgi:hypothetical protein
LKRLVAWRLATTKPPPGSTKSCSSVEP